MYKEKTLPLLLVVLLLGHLALPLADALLYVRILVLCSDLFEGFRVRAENA